MTVSTKYSFHTTCTHAATKADRARCRRAVRRSLDGMTVAELRAMARTVDLTGRSSADKATLVQALSFSPAVREVLADDTTRAEALAS